jgi:hypothetical protein
MPAPALPDACDVALARQNPGHELSKKQKWIQEKTTRVDVHLTSTDLPRTRPPGKKPAPAPATALVEALPPVPGTVVTPVTTLFNLHTRETLSLVPGLPVMSRLNRFLRDHFTNQATQMDGRLVHVLTHVARRFSAGRIEVVSGYRSPKYNMTLRKKGRQVARTSQHTEGNAVDFRLRGIPVRRLLNYVKSLKIGGVGYYPHSQFVHSDTGRIRYWRGS